MKTNCLQFIIKQFTYYFDSLCVSYVQTSLPELDEEGSIQLQPEQVLHTRDKQMRGRMIKEVLVKWKDTSPEDATWEPTTILQQFPQLQP